MQTNDIAALVADVQRLRQHHEFTRDRIGQPGCRVRRQAAEYVETIDRVLAALAALAALTTPSDRASGQGDGWQSIKLLDRGADDQKQVIAARFENGKMTMQARAAWPWEASWATHFIPMPAPPSDVVPGEQERGHV